LEVFKNIYKGMAPITKNAIETEKALNGNEITDTVFEKATEVMINEFFLPDQVPGNMNF
jgi:xanthine dehydrogenase iron-sulfur cluster and FAD-binding subunit A